MTAGFTNQAFPSPQTPRNINQASSYQIQPLMDNPTIKPSPEVKRLPPVLKMQDLIAFMVLIIVFVSNDNTLQLGGPVVFIYLILGLITFLIPSAYVTQWLGRHFPGQGAPYLWATRILGARYSLFFTFCSWWPGVLGVVSAIEGCILFIQYLVPTWFINSWEQMLGILIILSLATLVACIPLNMLKHILMGVVVVYVCLFLLQGLAGVWWLVSGHTPAVAFNIPDRWQLSFGNIPVYGVAILALLGIEIPLLFGGELQGGRTGARRATVYVWWGSALVFALYMIGTFALMVTVPSLKAGSLGANILIFQMVFGSFVGPLVTILYALIQVAITAVFLLSFSRLLFVIAQDKRLPAPLARVNKHGVPTTSIITQAIIVGSTTLLAFITIPSLLSKFIDPTELANAIYTVLLAGSIALGTLASALLFIFALIHLFRTQRRSRGFKRQRIIMVVVSITGIGACLAGFLTTLASSWFPIIPDNRWFTLVIGVFLLSLAIGWFASELPRMYALLNEQKRLNEREIALRQQLQSTYEEQEMLIQQQQVLLAEVDRLYKEQSQAAITDPITGLPNHRAVMRRIEEEVSRCERQDSSCAILFVDLDHFKRVNDTWGHLAGDAILREVGQRLRTTLRLEDYVGRYGGEEFAIVLTEATIDKALQGAERLRIAVSAHPCIWEGDDSLGTTHVRTRVQITITASIGVAIYRLHGITSKNLVEFADRGMYQAKNTGRNRVCIADIEHSNPPDKLQPYQKKPVATEIIAVQALTAAASARDRGTDEHAHRLVDLVSATASKLNRSEEEIHLIRLAALFHDIGKIGIPDAILHKPGPLEVEEWTIMRTHPEIGHKILEQVGGIFSVLAEIVLSHHERWDGKGYPRGLAREAIPISSRILSVVDSFDAMTSRRAYREPLTITEAIIELQQCSGTQFDPTVVTAFIQVLSEKPHILEEDHRDDLAHNSIQDTVTSFRENQEPARA